MSTGIGLDRIHAHETALVARRPATRWRRLNSVRLFGPEDSAGIVSFAIEGVHPHDVGTILDEAKVAIRAGHHCAQPLMEALGRRGDRARQLRRLQRPAGRRRAGPGHRASDEDIRMS